MNPYNNESSGIYYGWIIVAVVGLVGFSQAAQAPSVVGVFLRPITDEFGWSRTIFTSAVTVGTILGGILAIGIGPLIDRYGARWIFVITFFFIGSALILKAVMANLWQFYILEVIAQSLNMGIVFLAMSVIIPKWFISKRGRAIALSGFGARLGNTLTPLYVQFFIFRGNWRFASAIAGVAVWLLAITPAAVFMRRRPEDMGLEPDGIHSKSKSHVTSESKIDNQEISLGIIQVLKMPSFYLVVTAIALAYVVITALFLHLIPYFTDNGLGAGIGVVASSLVSGNSGLSSFGYGYLAERYSARKIFTLELLLIGSTFPLLLMVQSATQGIIWAIYAGLSMGGMSLFQQMIFADYYGRESLGTIRAMAAPVQLLAIALGPLIASAMFDITGTYIAIFLIFGTITLLASLCIFLSKPPLSQTRLNS